MKGETSMMSSIIAILAASSMFIGFGVYFGNLMSVNNQQVSPGFSYQSTFNNTYTQVDNITNVFKQTDPRTNPANIFDLTTVYIYQFANIIYNVPGIVGGMVNDVSEQLDQFGVPGWFIGFIIAGLGVFFTFKVASIVFRRGGDT